MDREPTQCTAGDLATDTLELIPANWSVGRAEEWLAENGYDVAPVVQDGQPAGYVALEDLGDTSDDGPVTAHVRPITLQEVISTDADFGAILSALYDQRFYFLGGRNQLTGILTRADLNTSPAYVHLYARLSLLEGNFRDLVLDEAPGWKENDDIDLYRDEIEGIERRYQRARSANIALNEIHYAQFSTLTKIVASSEACWRECDFGNGDVAARELSDVTDVRNAVAHSNLLVENTDGGLINGRTVGTVLDAYETMETCLDALDFRSD